MPRSEDILNSLHALANDYRAIAVFWHIISYLLIAFLMLNLDPSNRLFGIILTLPVVSVALFAWISGNPFNGTLFTILAVMFFLFALGSTSNPIGMASWPFLAIGIAMVIFGLVYPHFLETQSFIRYAIASPFGLIPCPTLSVVIGFLLIYNSLGSHLVALTLIIFGLFYGLFGAIKLRVYLDYFLIFGSLVLLVQFILMTRIPL
jgi:hypothetical protein